jgi:glycosyltransferase involved in cell wall biosynthesis
MRILVVHNRYREDGGEDVVYEAESELLENRGNAVARLAFDNRDIDVNPSAVASARLAVETIWSKVAAKKIADTAREFRAEIVHFHNTFPLVSPAAYWACKNQGTAIVQTLHNYRLICPAATLYRDGGICEDCLGRSVAWPSVVHACYRQSRPETSVVAAMIGFHRLKRTWNRAVDLYIALTEFSRKKLIEGGLPADRIIVKPNFFDAAAPNLARPEQRSDNFLFVGRLDETKGVQVLLEAWKRAACGRELCIIGMGPLADLVTRAAHENPSIRFIGRQDRNVVNEEMQKAGGLVFPSIWYEAFGMTLIEAFASGLPPIASDLGSMSEIVMHRRNGLLFEPGNADALVEQIRWACSNRAEMIKMGSAARSDYEAEYSSNRNYDLLMNAYHRALSD